VSNVALCEITLDIVVICVMTNTLLVLYAHVMLLMHFLGLDLIISAHLGDKLVNR